MPELRAIFRWSFGLLLAAGCDVRVLDFTADAGPSDGPVMIESGICNPIAEQCNNLDDDCDGAIDNQATDAGGRCGACNDGFRQCVADATTGQAQRLLAAGAVAYISKPLDVAELLRLIDRTVATP